MHKNVKPGSACTLLQCPWYSAHLDVVTLARPRRHVGSRLLRPCDVNNVKMYLPHNVIVDISRHSCTTMSLECYSVCIATYLVSHIIITVNYNVAYLYNYNGAYLCYNNIIRYSSKYDVK